MAAVTEQWRRAGRLAAVWDAGVKSEPIAQVYGVVVFGTDNRLFYRHIDELGRLAEGTKVLDVPCGGGVAFRGLRPERRLDFTAADISPAMLDRARAEARRRGLDWMRFVEANAQELPFEDGSFDVVNTYNGLHCFPDPRAAVAQMGRVLRPGGTLRGSTVIFGAGKRQDALIAFWRRTGIFGVVPYRDDVEEWLENAGLEDVSVTTSGAVAFFEGRRPAA